MHLAMPRLIRKYHAGGQIVVTEALRRKVAAGQPINDDIDRLDRALNEAEAMRSQAQQMLAHAQTQADHIVAEAKERAVALQAEAQAQGFQEGYEQGIKEGRTAGEQALSHVIQEMRLLLDSIRQQRLQVLGHAEQETVHLALAVAEKIIGPIACEHQDVIEHNVARALAELGETGPFALRVHPQDAAHLRPRWHSQGPPIDEDEWKLIEDESIEPGGCILLCGPATIDTRLSIQMKAIVEGLGLEA